MANSSGYSRDGSVYSAGTSFPSAWLSDSTAPAMSSTVFPCGHIVAYTGIPPMFCSACGQRHQNSALHYQNYYNQGQTGDVAAHTSVDIGTTMKVAYKPPKPPKTKTNLDWLDAQIDRVRKMAFDA